MARTAILAVKIIGDASGASSSFNQAETSAAKFERRLGTATKGAKVVGAGLLAMGVAANKYASELQQSDGAVQAVFGRQAKAIQALGKTSADSLGLARSEYQQTAAVFGAQLKNMGVSSGELVPTTDKLIKLGADLAATYGGPTSKAVEAIGSLMRGERDPIEAYGVGIKQADINARLAAQGQDKLTGAAKRTAETEATLALLMKQTNSAQGQRAREANTFAAQQERAVAKLKDAGAQFGIALLPVFTAVVAAMSKVADFATKHETAFKVLVIAAGVLATAIIVVNTAYKTYTAVSALVTAATTRQTVAQKAQNTAMRANPIGLVITAIALLVAGFVLAYKKSETFREIVNSVGAVGKKALGFIVDVAKDVAGWIGKVIDKISSLVSWIGKIKWPSVPKAISGLFGNGGPPASAYGGASRPAYSSLPGQGGPGSPGFMTRVSGFGGNGTYVNIRIDGALDPNAVARQIEQLLIRRGVKLGAAW